MPHPHCWRLGACIGRRAYSRMIWCPSTASSIAHHFDYYSVVHTHKYSSLTCFSCGRVRYSNQIQNPGCLAARGNFSRYHRHHLVMLMECLTYLLPSRTMACSILLGIDDFNLSNLIGRLLAVNHWNQRLSLVTKDGSLVLESIPKYWFETPSSDPYRQLCFQGELGDF